VGSYLSDTDDMRRETTLSATDNISTGSTSGWEL
jgi:hypothetical protein